MSLRKKIVEKKIEELNNLYSRSGQNFKRTQKILLVMKLQISVRELVGAINRIVSFSRIYNKIPNLS